MKKIIIPISTLFLAGFYHAQATNTENYVQTKVYLEPVNTSSSTAKQIQTVQYLDGLGRPKQVVSVKASPTGKDVVSHIEYDQYGRQVKDYLPVPQSGTQSGGIYISPLSNASTQYGSEKIYAEKIFESSPLNRVFEQKQVGNAWNDKPVKFEYDANSVADAVKKYTTTTTMLNGATNSVLSQTDYYGANKLFKNTVTDEDGNKTIEFKNGEGQTLLVRKMLDDVNRADTYYVYNEYNQLVYVIPPLAVVANALDSTTLNSLCYQYKYDGENRLVEKKLPGKGWEFMVYDKQDRLVLTQDANLRTTANNFAAKGWLFTKYDQFGRVVYTGFFSNTATRTAMQTAINSMAANPGNNEMRSENSFNLNGMDVFYTKNAFPTGSMKILSVNYYDSYPSYSFNPSFPSAIYGKPILTDNAATLGKSTKSLPVMTLVKNIEDDNWTKNYSYYDTKGRPIGSYSINHLGGFTKTESELDFAGTVLQTKTYHKRLNTDTEKVITETFTYDHQNRLLTHKHKIDNNTEEILAQNTYNELSQLQNKKVGGTNAATPLQSIDYAYNIRGWMTHINDPNNLGTDLFGYKINYNQREGLEVPNMDFSDLMVKPKFNGNIAEVSWKTQTEESEPLKRYGYVYDNLNRLSAGFYQKAGYESSKEFFEKTDYDLNGNITRLRRSEGILQGSTTALAIDNLKYDYTGNRLTKVTEEQIGNSKGYPYLASPNTITYDENGNMISHNDKGISNIGYNFLNLPNIITVNPGVRGAKSTQYIYRADGVKVSKTFAQSGLVVTTEYLDGFQYKLSTNSLAVSELQFVPTLEGYFDFQKNSYIYNYTDHLRNVRLSYSDANQDGVIQPRDMNVRECTDMGEGNIACTDIWMPGEIVEVNNYYPFGLMHNFTATTTNAYQYKYNGKELQETGFVSMDYRNYAPDIARFIGQDRLSEVMPDWTPYRFAFNNPVYFSDPTGLFEEGGNALAHCPTCPKTDEFKPYIDDKNNVYVYNSETNTASLKVTPIEEVVVTGKKSESNTNYHDWSQTLRKGSGYAFSANKMLFQPAFQSASQYGNPRPYTTTTLVFEKSLPKILGGRKIIYQPLMTMNAIKAGKISRGLKVTGRVLGVAGVGLAGYDMYENGVTTSNTLDLTMSALALSPTGVGQGIAAAYFLANGITILATGQDIGQHIDSSVGAYNDNVKAEEQQKFNEAMGY
ncbi:RHS repeat-associated core domain-containing protein [Chryseobacterium aquaticum]|uniref:RHS repeat-associated core domain-containing protein n=1 Tax=Chryseobacterium aquaticum TaxID=452084 RepID=A0A848N6Q4_9FLAO|nr:MULTISPECIES: DUF6443 domain-containing protein [Chryseobacterium]NMR34682.1 RHS repeat-associated core domain-containing protein [Chryseobacterium aquaticum]NRQ46932.1 RHS repeat-associated core domain-containing protein [Chryseobacterium sp. C-204]